MMLEHERGILSDAAEWHLPEEVKSETKPEMDMAIHTIEGKENAKLCPEGAVERFQPTPENPIKELRIGMWNTLGQIDRPTRVVMILKDGRTTDIPWEDAEKLLPPEFQAARELGERARHLQQEATSVMESIRGGSDVMSISGHAKDAVLRSFGRQRPELRYLNLVSDLVDEIAEIGQQSFLELRQMINIQKSRQKEIQNLAMRLDECERRFKKARTNTFRELPKVEDAFERIYKRQLQGSKSVGSGDRPELAEPEI